MAKVIMMVCMPSVRIDNQPTNVANTMAMITDYDCWKVEEEPVTAEAVISHLLANADSAKRILARVVSRIPAKAE
mgnify:CR=1 FL=1